jgi:hypothetical protein
MTLSNFTSAVPLTVYLDCCKACAKRQPFSGNFGFGSFVATLA